MNARLKAHLERNKCRPETFLAAALLIFTIGLALVCWLAIVLAGA